MEFQKYYKEIFPDKNMYKFLRLTPFRELTFKHSDKFYQRYISVKSFDEFRNTIRQNNPSQIHVGSNYTTVPQKNTFLDVKSRELVFDVDITDYKRTCGCDESENRKKLCEECFKIIKAAIGVLDYTMRENFGFKHILFVYSGGKGVHCWVMDEEAMFLDYRERKAIADFLKNSKSTKRTVKNGKLHTFVAIPAELENILDVFDVSIDHYLVLDTEVTANMKHLIKMPFSIHSNGNVSVPININTLESLKLDDFPTLSQSLHNKNLILPFLDTFDSFVNSME